MILLPDEGFTDGEAPDSRTPTSLDSMQNEIVLGMASEKDREELAYSLLASLPRSRLATVQRRLAPLLQFDVVGILPTEVALQIFSHLNYQSLLTCALVCKRWRSLADDQFLWKNLCRARGWEWKQPQRPHAFEAAPRTPIETDEDRDDEGMGDEELTPIGQPIGFHPDSHMSSISYSPTPSPKNRTRHSAPSILPSLTSVLRPNYKLLHQTHVRLHNRFLSSSYRLSALQTRGSPSEGHNSTIYCLQLYTYPETGDQSLFTGSRDRTVREWNLTTGTVTRVIGGVHEGSVLSICVNGGYLVSAGSDHKVVVWDLLEDQLVKVISDHNDSVLCVRLDGERLVSCSKDRTVRTYKFPELTPQFVLGAHRAAVNAVSISKNLIVSGSGDRSVRLWDANTSNLLLTFENHHNRGIASIDFQAPYILSGSSDKHLRMFNISSPQGWSTSPEYDTPPPTVPLPYDIGSTDHSCGLVCPTCGTNVNIDERKATTDARSCMHRDLVRSVALGDEFVYSGSYDLSIKIWERKTGALIADLSGGHTGRIFCIGFDCTKIVSCGEDQRICFWDFSHGIDTSFIKL